MLAKTVKIKAASTMPDSHPSSINLLYMAERLKGIFGGLIELEVYTSESVGGEADISSPIKLADFQASGWADT